MSNKETVQKGLDARKNVKAAEARAAQAEQKAAEANDDRLHERVNAQSERQAWEQEKHELVGQLDRALSYSQRLVDEIKEMRREARDQAKARELLLVELAKASAAIILLYTVRDLDLVAFWLANGLVIASELYLTILLVKLFRKK